MIYRFVVNYYFIYIIIWTSLGLVPIKEGLKLHNLELLYIIGAYSTLYREMNLATGVGIHTHCLFIYAAIQVFTPIKN